MARGPRWVTAVRRDSDGARRIRGDLPRPCAVTGYRLVVACVVGLAAAVVACGGKDCGTFEADAAAFSSKTGSVSRQERAETLVQCGHLRGRTLKEITAALGRAPYQATDD